VRKSLKRSGHDRTTTLVSGQARALSTRSESHKRALLWRVFVATQSAYDVFAGITQTLKVQWHAVVAMTRNSIEAVMLDQLRKMTVFTASGGDRTTTNQNPWKVLAFRSLKRCQSSALSSSYSSKLEVSVGDMIFGTYGAWISFLTRSPKSTGLKKGCIEISR